MLFIRNMKMQRAYEPNLRHCLYGLDADLIFLALVSHEPHFFLLREEVVFGAAGQGRRRRRRRRGEAAPQGVLKNMDEFQLLHISLLRDCLHLEFSPLAVRLPLAGRLRAGAADRRLGLPRLPVRQRLPAAPADAGHRRGRDWTRCSGCTRTACLSWTAGSQSTARCTSQRLEVILRKMGGLEEDVFQRRLEDSRDSESGGRTAVQAPRAGGGSGRRVRAGRRHEAARPAAAVLPPPPPLLPSLSLRHSSASP